MIDARLSEALSNEREGRFIESFRRCLEILADQPGNAAALALASRLSLMAGDAPNAIAYACEAVRADGANPGARQALDAAHELRKSAVRSVRIYTRAVELEPDIADHVAIPGSQLPFDAMAEVRALLDESLELDPGLAQAHAAAGNLAMRRGEYLAALGAYQRAAFIAARAEYELAASELLFTLGQFSEADAFRKRALDRRRFFPGRKTRETEISVLALMAPGPWPVNAPLDFAIDKARIRLSRLYLTGAPVDRDVLAQQDVVLNAIGEAEEAQTAIRDATELCHVTRFLNDPSNSYKTSRPALADALGDIPECVAPATQRISRTALQSASSLPLLARPVDSHGGRGLSKLETHADIDAYLFDRPEGRFDVSPFIEYKSEDGFYRKYRVALVDGVPYPYHLAISPQWMVHYIGSPTGKTPWMQAEEEWFLAHPERVFECWTETFPKIAHALGLDYFAIDCALLFDGRVLVFEADIAALLHCSEAPGSYKYRYVPKIFRALERMLSGR